jgi:hypothetical protein
MSSFLKLAVFVPESHADVVRQALGQAGAGKLGNYAFCSFSVKGTGRFLPLDGAHPALGNIGKLETVDEERIEVLVPRAVLPQVLAAMKAAHPYEQVAYDIYPLEDV